MHAGSSWSTIGTCAAKQLHAWCAVAGDADVYLQPVEDICSLDIWIWMLLQLLQLDQQQKGDDEEVGQANTHPTKLAISGGLVGTAVGRGK